MLRTVLIIIVVAIVVAAVGVAYAVFRTPEEASAPIQAVPLVVETTPAVAVATEVLQAPALEPTATRTPQRHRSPAPVSCPRLPGRVFEQSWYPR